MMQAPNIKSVLKPQQDSQALPQAQIKQAKILDAETKNLADASKTASFNRLLEAYSDCV